jgi:S1-C subfamily serine protease
MLMPAIRRAAAGRARLVCFFAAFTTFAPLIGTAFAQDAESTVYIKCDGPDGKTSRGSGVIVSEDGRVLTAKHVAPSADYKCRGVLGTAAEEPTRTLLRRKSSPDYDALLLYFVPKPGEKFRPVYVVELDPELQGRAIAAYGFPATGTGEVSVRTGTISTTTPNEAGMIETDALTTRGMSGGPVFLKDTPGGRALVGIVAGANFDPGAGNEADFAVLAVELLRDDFDLLTIEDLIIERTDGGSGREGTGGSSGNAPAAGGVSQLAGKWSGDAAEPGGYAFEVEMDVASDCAVGSDCG